MALSSLHTKIKLFITEIHSDTLTVRKVLDSQSDNVTLEFTYQKLFDQQCETEYVSFA